MMLTITNPGCLGLSYSFVFSCYDRAKTCKCSTFVGLCGSLRSIVVNNLRLDMGDMEVVISDLSKGVEIIRESLHCAIWCVV